MHQPVDTAIYLQVSVGGKHGYIRCLNNVGEAEMLSRARFICWLRYGAKHFIPFSLVHVRR